MIHRIRSRLVHNRTTLSNEIRGFLLEYGVAIPKGIKKLPQLVFSLLDNAEDQHLSSVSIRYFKQLIEEFQSINAEVKRWEEELERAFESSEAAQRIEKIERRPC